MFLRTQSGTPEQQIEFSKIVYRTHLANEAIESLIKKDSEDITLHYQLLSNIHETWDEVHRKIIKSDNIPDPALEYQRMASSSSPRMRDIGNFGLGVEQFFQNDYDNVTAY